MTPPRDPRQGWLLGGRRASPLPEYAQGDQLSLGLTTALPASCAAPAADALGKATVALRELGPVDRAQLAAAWRRWLIETYPERGRAKAIARDFACSTRTAESWLAHDAPAPSGQVLASAIRLHGLVVVARVIAPGSALEPLARALDVQAVADSLEAKLHQLAAEAAALKGQRE